MIFSPGLYTQIYFNSVMDKLEQIKNGVFVLLMVLAIYVFYHYYFKEPPNEIDENQDGIITKEEVINYIKKELDRRNSNPPQFRGVLKSSISGVIRGALMGLMINGVEGAVVGGIVLGMINPIMTGIEHMY